MDKNIFKRITDRIDTYRDAMVELQIGLAPFQPSDRKMAGTENC